MITSLRPYVCRRCIQKLSLQRSAVTSVRHISAAPYAFLPDDGLSKPVQQRVNELGGLVALDQWYPRWRAEEGRPLSAQEFLQKFDEANGRDSTDEPQEERHITVYGRVKSRRNQGSRLTFLDLESGGKSLQAVLNPPGESHQESANAPSWDLKEERRHIRRGDWLALTGHAYTTSTGQQSIRVLHRPKMLAPILQPLPESISDLEFINHNRHVGQIIKGSAWRDATFRSRIIRQLRAFFEDRDFVEVNTPLLTANAGGANARPFVTVATEFPQSAINLRVAPELFLKRLIVGGMERVFEIGPVFRNEGIDATHNPEFYTCEFYEMMADLNHLIAMTEQLWTVLGGTAKRAHTDLQIGSPPAMDLSRLTGPYKRIEFVPALEKAIHDRSLDFRFPNLSNEAHAHTVLQTVLSTLDPGYNTFTAKDSTPTLLDRLCSLLLEPQSEDAPLWITHHPECMSPLAKSFTQAYATTDGTVHRVSARAELFIQGREYVNCYEEENSSVEQRRKLLQQRRYQLQEKGKSVEDAGEDEMTIDENYVQALEWGMPPTGGWGCGIDRLVMLLSGKKRIADVLPFGTLANVVGLGSRGPRASKPKRINP